MGEKSSLFDIHFITEAEIKGEEDMTKVEWNSVKEVGFPKDLTKYYYVTYKDFDDEIKVAITKFIKYEDGDILAYSLDINDEGILAWAETDVTLPEPYVQKEEIQTDEKEMTIGDYIRQASNKDIASLIGMYITEYRIDMMKETMDPIEVLEKSLGESINIVKYMVKINDVLSLPYKGSIYERAKTNAKKREE